MLQKLISWMRYVLPALKVSELVPEGLVALSDTGLRFTGLPLTYNAMPSISRFGNGASTACVPLLEAAKVPLSTLLGTTPLGSYAAFQHPTRPAPCRSV